MTDKDLLNSIKHHLDKRVGESSSELKSELSSCRQQAIARAMQKRNRAGTMLSHFQFNMVRVWGAAVAISIVVLVAINFNSQQYPDINDVVDIEILVTEDALEFYEELEFYQWLVLEDEHST